MLKKMYFCHVFFYFAKNQLKYYKIIEIFFVDFNKALASDNENQKNLDDITKIVHQIFYHPSYKMTFFGIFITYNN